MSEQNWRFLARLYLAGVFVVLGATFLHYGLTWDEEVHRMYGECILKWYGSLFRDVSAVDFQTLHFYGGFFDAAAALTARILPFGVYESRHLANTVFGFLGILFSYRLGKHFSGAAGGFFSALFLTFTPVFYGHIFNNPKDIPFAAMFLLSLYYLILSYDALPRLPGKLLLKLSLALGLMLGIRIGGVFIFGYAALLWGAWLMIQFWAVKGLAPFGEHFKRTVISFAGILVISWCVMLLFWPWAQVSPLRHPWRALTTFSNFDWPLPVFFYGRYIPARQLPWDYLPSWFFISLPEFYFISLIAGCFLGLRFFTGGQNSSLERRPVKLMFLAAVVLFPIFGVMIFRPTVYDGLRQFLFLLPPLAVLAGTSWAELICSTAAPRLKKILYAAVFVSGVLTLWDMARLHPYENIYFNRLAAGSMKRAARNFETDYWGNSYKEGAEWLIQNYPSLFPDGRKIRVANYSRPFLTGYFLQKTEELRKHFETVNPNEHPDIFMAITRWNGHESREGKVLHIVRRCDVSLLYIIQPEAKQGGIDVAKESGYNTP